MSAPLLQVNDLKMHFPVREGLLLRARKFNRAVDGVSLSIGAGETLGLVGESGCGKSTLGFSILRLLRPPGRIVSGRILYHGRDIVRMTKKEILALRATRSP